MKIENTDVSNFGSALRAMRNPMNSWDRSDSNLNAIHIGADDLKLACKLVRGGSEHRKFLRQIIVWADFTLPRYVWQEMDTYKVATVRNSCSTMHKLGHAALEPEDFELQHVNQATLEGLNLAGECYRSKDPFVIVPGAAWATLDVEERTVLKDYDIVRWMKGTLPESFLQKATMTFSYETLLSMYMQRHNHRLPQWSGGSGSICNWIYHLPYMCKFIEAAMEKRR